MMQWFATICRDIWTGIFKTKAYNLGFNKKKIYLLIWLLSIERAFVFFKPLFTLKRNKSFTWLLKFGIYFNKLELKNMLSGHTYYLSIVIGEHFLAVISKTDTFLSATSESDAMFCYKVIRDFYSIYHLCINPIHSDLSIRVIISASGVYKFNVLLNNCKQNITSLPLLVGTTVALFLFHFGYFNSLLLGVCSFSYLPL